jgi:peptide deformylase
MAILPLIIAPDEILKQPSKAVTDINDAVRELLDDMADTMYFSRGIGLAAVQVGVHLKMVVVDISWDERDDSTRRPMKLINPEILESSQTMRGYKEGCLSFPEQYSEVERPDSITIRYLDENGSPKQVIADGLLATCLQHEIDHTNGITFVDHISRLKRDMIHKKLNKMKKAGAFEDDHVHGPDCNHGHHHHGHVHGPDCQHD